MAVSGRAITVVGGGVAGLSVALALAQRGAEVTVLEQAEEIREVGAGLQISPNGVVVLRALGLGEALEATSVRGQGVRVIDGPSGAPVMHLDLNRLRPDQGYYFVHRADLIEMLAVAAREAGVQIRLLQRIEGARATDDGMVLKTVQGAEIRPALVIGADGLHSPIGAALNGRVAPFFTHQVAWRALVPEAPEAEPVAKLFTGPGRHLVSYPLRGGTMRNIVAVEERRRWVEEGWNQPDDPLSVQVAFETFCPEVKGWLSQINKVYLWGLFRHPVARVWQAPGVAILGDAAHPTLPFMAQGANMALEDAWALAALLDGADDTGAALKRYQDLRLSRVARIVEAANKNARIYHLSGLSRLVAQQGMRLGGAIAPAMALRRFDWIYDYDVTTAVGRG